MKNCNGNYENIRQALEDGLLINIEFAQDGSCARFYFYTTDNARAKTQSITVGIDEAVELISGFRFIQHELKTCF